MKFKILMHEGKYVDMRGLSSGIITVDTPELHSSDITIESEVRNAETIGKELNVNMGTYIKNLKKCRFVECDMTLSTDTGRSGMPNDFLADVRELVDYDYPAEEDHFGEVEEGCREGHIFNTIRRIDEFLRTLGK